ncbi:2-oxoglutarate dehydrogenase complex component E1-like [Lycorma delicatula]|uniref:2-oxoglutarate dehydrogenase complex component E1-like n=1 Tax=Lycorma delicatula TaxID=130591 RepID=UPI003F5105EB
MVLAVSISILNNEFRKTGWILYKSHHLSAYESFLNSTSCVYVEELYLAWKKDPRSVHVSWHTFFKLVESGKQPGHAYQSPITAMIQTVVAQPKPKIKGPPPISQSMIQSPAVSKQITPVSIQPAITPSTKYGSIEEHLKLFTIIDAYQRRGHLLAQLDPLGIARGPGVKKHIDLLDDPILKLRKIPTDTSVMYRLPKITFVGGKSSELSLQEIIDRLKDSYCQTIGIELAHVEDHQQANFIKEMFEDPDRRKKIIPEHRKLALNRLYYAHGFEAFLAKKWPAEKRFGLEGCDAYVPAIRHIMEVASNHGAQYFVMGMAHRGRLNTLANVMEKPLEKVFAHFQSLDPEKYHGTGDVKYHMGSTTNIKHGLTDKNIRISLCANPSHLESINPIVNGKAAAEQIFFKDTEKTKVWPVLIHGDAAVCGQGIVYETFHLSELLCFKTGGTVHIVLNNQIGFTTDPYLSRSSEYCTAVAKVLDVPIIHVNADDVDAVIYTSHVAAEYRAKFQNDIVIDLVGYRRFGHNEVDEPMFTQPNMYTIIKNIKPVYYKYKQQLLDEKVVTEDEIKTMEQHYQDKLEKAYNEAKNIKSLNPDDWLSSPWSNFFTPTKDPYEIPATGIGLDVLMKIGTKVSTPPENFTLHRGIERILASRRKMLENKIADWAFGELFSFGSLLQEQIFVRLSGQDVERGTFSHRHHVLHDQNDGRQINVLQNIFENQATYSLCNSSLSEFGVLGFEFGMSLVNPNTLLMWEAQFGDFSNSAQVIIDQYLSSGGGKWYRHCGVVVLLPHGLEGMGPEHSSARPERFLQLCDDDDTEINTNMADQLVKSNWLIVNASTPANFFHVLRRQVKVNYRKPLIIFTPKSLLRLPECVSPFSDFIENTKFKPYLKDPEVPPSKDVVKLLLCTGKVYYDLREMRAKQNLRKEIAIGRIEQLFPLPYEDIENDALKSYPNARLFWVQEEHKNQGAWTYVSPRLNRLMLKAKGRASLVFTV